MHSFIPLTYTVFASYIVLSSDLKKTNQVIFKDLHIWINVAPALLSFLFRPFLGFIEHDSLLIIEFA